MKLIHKFLFTILIFSFFIYSTIAQSIEFRILAAKGVVMVQKNGRGNWEKIFTGGQINTNDKIKLSPGAYLGLVHTKGKTLEIKKDGIYSVTQLSKQVTGMKTTMSGQLANLIITEVGASSGLLSNNGNKNQSQSGVVERRLDTESISYDKKNVPDDKIIIKSPVKEHIIDQEIIFEWSSFKSENEYEFYLTDRYDRLELSRTTKDTFIVVNTQQIKLEKGYYYFWRVVVKHKPELKSDEACFMVLTDNEIKQINDSLKILKGELGNEQSAPSMLMYAVFFEKYNLINEAKSSYLSALKFAPDVDVYSHLYQNFLKRHYQSGF
ncbi:MAG: hypothetical protein EPN82_09890 [Bacteroidetes bacterium]|nr:MAG: hypothetical protein EPN82_09890 [Bacteroidota bacterium]